MLQVKQVDSTVEAGAQFQQMVNVECVQDFSEQPDLSVNFYYNGNPTTIKCKLPISINKFIEPTEMSSEVKQQINIVNPSHNTQLNHISTFSGVFLPMEESKSASSGVPENI